MSAWELPTSLEIGGVGFSIRSDYRAILDILSVYADPDYEDDEKAMVCIRIFYPDWENIAEENLEEALTKANEFIDAGITGDKNGAKLMDWEQDAPLIIPAVNHVLGTEIRSMPYLHWWTFVGAYMEIGESLFSSVVSVRKKKSTGKLEKWDREFIRDNKSLVELKRRETEEERMEREKLERLLNGK